MTTRPSNPYDDWLREIRQAQLLMAVTFAVIFAVAGLWVVLPFYALLCWMVSLMTTRPFIRVLVIAYLSFFLGIAFGVLVIRP